MTEVKSCRGDTYMVSSSSCGSSDQTLTDSPPISNYTGPPQSGGTEVETIEISSDSEMSDQPNVTESPPEDPVDCINIDVDSIESSDENENQMVERVENVDYAFKRSRNTVVKRARLDDVKSQRLQDQKLWTTLLN